jgi:hypothetical protein
MIAIKLVYIANTIVAGYIGIVSFIAKMQALHERLTTFYFVL